MAGSSVDDGQIAVRSYTVRVEPSDPHNHSVQEEHAVEHDQHRAADFGQQCAVDESAPIQAEPYPLVLADDKSTPLQRAASTPAPDPWAHRRGEPRLFAVLWVMYVMAAMIGSVQWVYGATDVTQESYSPAARIMLIVIAVGACVLWPMVRLSQSRPRGSVLGAVALDSWVVLVPVLMVVWPMIYMAGWPLEVVIALSALVLVWVVLAAGVLANALIADRSFAAASPARAAIELARVDDPQLPIEATSAVSVQVPAVHAPAIQAKPVAGRAAWMGLMLLLVLGGPFAGLALRAVNAGAPGGLGRSTPDWLDMLSPFTGVLAISGRGIAGPQNFVSKEQWLIMLVTGLVGALAWIAAWLRSIWRTESA